MKGKENKMFLEHKDKVILDVACGPKLFWFNKKHPYVLYNDIRVREKGYNEYRPKREIKPDTTFDFRELPFTDKCFKLVVFDPPHIISNGETFRMVKDYGYLKKDTWKEDIKKGFDECWRVLDDYGVLIFKWNETSVKKKEILEVIGREPLFGHPIQSKIPTHWFCFMKFPEDVSNPKLNEWLLKKVKQGDKQ